MKTTNPAAKAAGLVYEDRVGVDPSATGSYIPRERACETLRAGFLRTFTQSDGATLGREFLLSLARDARAMAYGKRPSTGASAVPSWLLYGCSAVANCEQASASCALPCVSEDAAMHPRLGDCKIAPSCAPPPPLTNVEHAVVSAVVSAPPCCAAAASCAHAWFSASAACGGIGFAGGPLGRRGSAGSEGAPSELGGLIATDAPPEPPPPLGPPVASPPKCTAINGAV